MKATIKTGKRNPNKAMKGKLQFRLPDDLTKFLEKEAERKGEKFSVVVRGILRTAMENAAK